jgi:hypothetical protein
VKAGNKGINQMADNRQRATILSKAFHEQRLQDEAMKKAKKAEEEVRGGDAGPPKKKKKTKCQYCLTTSDEIKVEGSKWSKCGVSGCQQYFCCCSEECREGQRSHFVRCAKLKSVQQEIKKEKVGEKRGEKKDKGKG